MHDGSSVAVALAKLQDYIFYFLQILSNLNPTASICVLARLYDPNIQVAFVLSILVVYGIEFFILLILQFLDMECEGNGDFERIYV